MGVQRPTANLFAWNFGTGLSRHLRILADVLNATGFDVRQQAIPQRGRGDMLYVHARRLPWIPGRADVNVFVQDIVPSWIPRARTNVFIPMQEWFDEREIRLLRGIDIVACNSEHAREIFSRIHPRSEYIGFTSDDRQTHPLVEKTDRILHIAGRSPYKGLQVLLDVWAAHPEWPMLTVTHGEGLVPHRGLPNVEQLDRHLTDEDLRRLQNEAWLHIQPSEAEGFGHCLCEAFSVGGLVITTDAPPMNELVQAERGVLVPSMPEPIRLNMGWRFPVDPAALERTIANALKSGSNGSLGRMREARRWYEENDRQVRERLTALFRSAMP